MKRFFTTLSTSHFARRTSHFFARGFLVGAGFGSGLAVVAALAVTVGTIKTWTSGETLTASDLNTTISSLKTAIEGIPDWTKSGSDAVYSAGNVGIGTTSPSFSLTVGSGAVGSVHSSHRLVVTDTSTHPRLGVYENNKGVSLLADTNYGGYGAVYAYDYGASSPLPLILNSLGGNVGIGTTGPTAKLHISESAGTGERTVFVTSANGVGAGISLESTSSGGRQYGIFSSAAGAGAGAGKLAFLDYNAMQYRLVIDSNGNLGAGTTSPSYPLHMGSGAYVSTGGVWTNASSREYKENIKALGAEEALAAVTALQPKTFRYKADPSERHVGFVAEDVPNLLATQDRKGLSAMDIVAVLTKVVQEQQKEIQALRDDMRRATDH